MYFRTQFKIENSKKIEKIKVAINFIIMGNQKTIVVNFQAKSSTSSSELSTLVILINGVEIDEKVVAQGVYDAKIPLAKPIIEVANDLLNLISPG